MVKPTRRNGKDLSTAEKRESLKRELRSKLPSVRLQQDEVNNAIVAAREFAAKDVNHTIANNRVRSQELYQKMFATADSNVDSLRKLLAEVNLLQQASMEAKLEKNLSRTALMQLLNDQGACLPLFVARDDEFAPPYVGGIHVPDSISLVVGEWAAVWVRDCWIIAEVLAVTANGRYEVKDIDNDNNNNKATVTRKYIIPLPKWRADPKRDGHALFPVNAIVLARYPQSTCFYRGVVMQCPKTATDDYQVAFDNEDSATGLSAPFAVAQRYVVHHKEIGKKKDKTAKGAA